MKFGITRKLNLSNIDRDLWAYETEDIVVSDADSFEEAQQTADKLVAERMGYYKAKSEEAKNPKVEKEVVPETVTPQPEVPVATTVEEPKPIETPKSGPPAEFQVD